MLLIVLSLGNLGLLVGTEFLISHTYVTLDYVSWIAIKTQLVLLKNTYYLILTW